MALSNEGNMLAHGNWGSSVTWELHGSNQLPQHDLITSVFCVAMLPRGEVLLTRNRRGWEILGGHIEEEETLEGALIRECMEEGGYYPTTPHLFAYRKIVSSKPIPHQAPRKNYPFPVSYQCYYWATTERPLVTPTGSEIFESKPFTIKQISKSELADGIIIAAGYRAYSLSK